MLSKIWKKLLLAILIIACLFNIIIKLVNKVSLENELESSAQYIYDQQQERKNKINKFK